MDSRVVVVIPTFNRAALLREAVESVLGQTYRDLELVVVDDGSNDGTRSYLRSLGDPRVKIVEQDHCGNPGKLRNLGVGASHGEWIAFLDSDDLWYPTKLERQLHLLAEHPEYQWSFTDFVRIDDRGDDFPGLRKPGLRSGWILNGLLDGSVGIALPTVVIRRGFFETSGAFDESFATCEDDDLWIRLASRGMALAVNEPLAAIRSHPGNARAWQPEVFENLRLIFGRLRLNDLETETRQLLNKKYAWILAQLSGLRRLRGQHAAALQLAGAAVWSDWASWGTWKAAIKAFVYPLIPSPLRERYYRKVATPRKGSWVNE
jgi:glycosyltransferase involved in cell wall biosynthesis